MLTQKYEHAARRHYTVHSEQPPSAFKQLFDSNSAILVASFGVWPYIVFMGTCVQHVATNDNTWQTIANVATRAHSKQSMATYMEMWPFCEKPVCPDPVWKTVSCGPGSHRGRKANKLQHITIIKHLQLSLINITKQLIKHLSLYI